MENRSFPQIVSLILQLKCPKCGQAKIFAKRKTIIAIPDMHHSCTNCNYKFDREPGYFLGAMYASYGLAVLEGISSFLILKFGLGIANDFFIAVSIASIILILSIWNYKLARAIWINVFP